MKRSEGKPGIQRRRSSGTFRLGKLRLRETSVVPAKNATFNFGGDGGSTNSSAKPKLLKSPNKEGRPATIQAPATMSTPFTTHAPIPMPSGHIHRTASELNLLLEQKYAVKHERIMFQRIVSGMVSRKGREEFAVSVTTTSSQKHIVEARGTPASSTLSHVKDVSDGLLDDIEDGTTKTEVPTPPAQTQTETSPATQPNDLFVGSYHDFKRLTSPRHVSSSLLKLQEDALGMNAPGNFGQADRRYSDLNDRPNVGNTLDDEEDTSEEEVFPIDI
mmetsp:Transcript_26157/g.75516  ORF Transcript_26157/g.75516 Transcript_26157/m.75516 type:complete len:274 (+) Transcript_26157:24-845(+)